eukprot:5784803-Prymnesium_polylepis.2
MQPVSDCRIKVALRVSKASVSPRLALAVTAEGVKATIDVTVDVPGRTRLALNVQRALAPVKAYGLQRIASSPMPASPRPRRSTRPSGGTHVVLTLGLLKLRRLPPEPLGKGWAIRPPATRTVLTEEQRALLVECFEQADRPNEAQAHERFKARFKERDGKFARSLVRSAAQIKSWFSAEKQRRQKAAVVHAAATAALDEEDGTEEAAADGRGGSGGNGGGGAAGDGGGAGKWPDVPTMRKEMGALGHAAEAKTAKGTKAVRTAWAFAKENPRAAACSSSAQRQSEKVTRHFPPPRLSSIEPAWHES